MNCERVAILDFGSQYSQLIARRVRELGVYAEILPYNVSVSHLAKDKPKAIILSGGPASLTATQSPVCEKEVFELGVPTLGICYGMQLMGKLLGGEIVSSLSREYGQATLLVNRRDDLFRGLDKELPVWMSHGDRVSRLPPGFEVIAHTRNSPMAAMRNKARQLYGVQFHPEVVHTPKGKEIIKNFLYQIAKCSPTWTMKSFLNRSLEEIRQGVGEGKVLCALSGGVDSSVLCLLLHKAIGERSVAVFVDNGLLRKDEGKRVKEIFESHYHLNLRYVEAGEQFLEKLRGVTDPEKKRRIIGNEFIKVFEEEARKIKKVKYLAQGTLYPDVIESRSARGGPSATIKTHHNVGGLPEEMNLELIEPFKELFKDEVRILGKELGLPEEIIHRHPFPGPGLAVRIVGEVSEDRLSLLREADEMVLDEIKKEGLYAELWQAFAVLLPIKTVGVMGDERTYENVVAIRAVTSTDGMTADWAKLPDRLLRRISNRIINEAKGINRVVYDISSKPPSTIEWE
ncbi:glutamine-hydrolyzing GMP synthase [candidate division NPL-UPA2 bacterium]|nr:glutamine-hydrolyzing GMP synthase [candidate division NPL-UPA2 bacterium]